MIIILLTIWFSALCFATWGVLYPKKYFKKFKKFIIPIPSTEEKGIFMVRFGSIFFICILLLQLVLSIFNGHLVKLWTTTFH